MLEDEARSVPDLTPNPAPACVLSHASLGKTKTKIVLSMQHHRVSEKHGNPSILEMNTKVAVISGTRWRSGN